MFTIKEAVKLFLNCDKDANGQLSLEELKAGMESYANISIKADADKLLEKIDQDDNKKITFKECLIFLRKERTLVTSNKEAIDFYNKYDEDHNGRISMEELKAGLEEFDNKAIKEDAVKLLKRIDQNESNTITIHECIKFFKQEDIVLSKIEEDEELFTKLDKDRDGQLSMEEFRAGLERYANNTNKEDAENWLKEVHKDGNKTISLKEWIEFFNQKDWNTEKYMC